MNSIKTLVQGVMAAGTILMATGCVVEPREAYYDHEHNRYYHEHAWHECGEHNDFCR